MKRIFISLVLILTLTGIAFSNTNSQPSWKTLQNAQQAFIKNDYTSAMKITQDALEQRKAESEHRSTVLTNALKPYQVRKAGEFIGDVLAVLQERQEYEAIEIIQNCVDLLGMEYFNGSIKNVTEYIKKFSEYPEAYLLLARIYRLEGEYKMAGEFLEKARSNSDLLDIPEEKTDILYEIAQIADYLNDDITKEKSLLLIAQNDGEFRNETLKNAILRTSKSNKEDNSSRFFMLYRIEAVPAIKAYYDLSDIYLKNKKYQDAYISNIYGTLICFTHINSLLEERESDYNFSDLESFFNELKRYPDIMKWCNDTGFWQGMYNICDMGLKNGFIRFPKDIIKQLAAYCPESYWKNASEKRLAELNITEER